MLGDVVRRVSVVLVMLIIGAGSAVAGNNSWTSAGPFGGSVGRITVHSQNPNLVFATGESLFRSTNGGGSWEPIEFGSGLTVRIHPRTGEVFAFGYDVFRSTNQGATWQLTGSKAFKGSFAVDADLDASNPQVLYASTRDKGVFRSADGGKTWAQRNSGLDLKGCSSCYSETFVRADPRNSSNVYTTTVNLKVYKSTNAGGSWKLINNGLTVQTTISYLAIDPSNSQVLYTGGGGGIFKSTNGGGAWTRLNCDCDPPGDLAIDPRNPQILYGASLGVIKSLDAGKTWKLFPLPRPTSYLPAIAASGSVVYAGAYNTGIYRSGNGGAAWKQVINGMNSAAIVDLAVSPQKPTTLFASGNGTVFRSTNSGAKWDPLKSAVNVHAGTLDVHPQNPNLIVASDYACNANVSTNGGATWKCSKSMSDFSAEEVLFDPQNQNTIFGARSDKGIIRSTDRGGTWSLINSGLTDTQVVSLAARDSQNLFAGTRNGNIFRSVNGGSSWEGSSIGSGNVSAIVTDRTNASVVYAATDYRGKGIYKSTDGGRTWVLKNKGLGSSGPGNLAGHPSNPATLYVAAYDSIYVTNDGAENWSRFPSNGMGPRIKFAFLVNPVNTNLFYTGTGRGVFTYGRTVAPGGPVLDLISPTSAKVGATVTLSGSGFGNSQGSSKVFFGSVDAGNAQSWSDTRITTRVPSGTQTGAVTVQVGSKRSNPVDFAVPSSSGKINPASGPASGGNRVSLTVSSLPSGTILVTFGASLATAIDFAPPNVLTCTVPPGSGTVAVNVVTTTSKFSLGNYTYR